ncbi:MAG: lysophospholipase L1-like esterase [Halioglobus sp.]
MSKPTKQFSLKQKVQYTSVIVLFFLLIMWLFGEVILRVTAKPTEYSNKSIIHEQLGWVPKQDYSASYKMKNFGENGISYKVNYRTEKYGFRKWGDPNSLQPKVWFIGDSFVQSVEASNEDLFYKHIGDSLDIEVFAFGQAGYGILQEKLILDSYIEKIKPDLIIWQVCDNDFVDNYAPLEYNSGYKVGLRRPYLNKDGSITYRKPVPKWQEVVDKSKFLALIRKKLQNTFGDKTKITTQKMINDLNKEYPPYLESLEITKMIVASIKETTKNIPIIAFSASRFEPSLTNISEIFEGQNIPLNNKLGRQIQKKSKEGPILLSKDGYHWNPAGQRFVADMLIPDVAKALYKIKTNN